MKIKKTWQQLLLLTIISNFLIVSANLGMVSILPNYVLKIGGNHTIVGLLTTLLTASALVFRPIFGRYMDTKGRRKVALFGALFFSLTILMMIYATHPILLLVLRLMQGVGLSAFSSAFGVIISDVVEEDKLDESLGYLMISSTLGQAIAPTLGFFLVDAFSYTSAFIVLFLFAILSALLIIGLNYEKNTEEKKVYPKMKLNDLFERTSFKTCFYIIFVIISIASVFSFLPVYSATRGFNGLGFFYVLYAGALTITRMVVHHLKKIGYRTFLYVALISLGSMSLLLVLANHIFMVYLAGIFYGIGMGIFQPIVNTIVLKEATIEHRGRASSTFYATLDFSYGAGSLLWGVIAQSFGFDWVYGLGIVSLMIAGIIMKTVLKETLSHYDMITN